ncbi:hypothetical protein AN280_05095 [Pseudomonas aeruginosa]|nr:hypothetical protein AN280_05095 [Pseudomonas aeruginosa]
MSTQHRSLPFSWQKLNHRNVWIFSLSELKKLFAEPLMNFSQAQEFRAFFIEPCRVRARKMNLLKSRTT